MSKIFMPYLLFNKFWYQLRKKCHESELKEQTSFLFHHVTTASNSCAMQTIRIRWYVATWDSPRGINTLQQQDAGIREIATRTKWTTSHIQNPGKTLRENIRNAGNLREQNGTNENDWMCGCVKQCIASFLYFTSSFSSGKTRTHISSAAGI